MQTGYAFEATCLIIVARPALPQVSLVCIYGSRVSDFSCIHWLETPFGLNQADTVRTWGDLAGAEEITSCDRHFHSVIETVKPVAMSNNTKPYRVNRRRQGQSLYPAYKCALRGDCFPDITCQAVMLKKNRHIHLRLYNNTSNHIRSQESISSLIVHVYIYILPRCKGLQVFSRGVSELDMRDANFSRPPPICSKT